MSDDTDYFSLPDNTIELESTLRDYLFKMSPSELSSFFIKYEAYYGESAARYAKSVLPKWASGQVWTSSKTDKRLLSVVPLFMSPDFRVKYITCMARKNYHVSMVPNLSEFSYYSPCISRRLYHHLSLELYRHNGIYPEPYGSAFHALHNFLHQLAKADIEVTVPSNNIPWFHEGVGLVAKTAAENTLKERAKRQLVGIFQNYNLFLKRLKNNQQENSFVASFPDKHTLHISVKNMGLAGAVFNRITNIFQR